MKRWRHANRRPCCDSAFDNESCRNCGARCRHNAQLASFANAEATVSMQASRLSTRERANKGMCLCDIRYNAATSCVSSFFSCMQNPIAAFYQHLRAVVCAHVCVCIINIGTFTNTIKRENTNICEWKVRTIRSWRSYGWQRWWRLTSNCQRHSHMTCSYNCLMRLIQNHIMRWVFHFAGVHSWVRTTFSWGRYKVHTITLMTVYFIV